jgi:cytochrome c biogenesis protein ResB
LDVAKIVLTMAGLKKISRIFSPRRLALYLALIIGGLSLLGLIVPQNRGDSYYDAHYYAWYANALIKLGLTGLYHAWYFVALIGLLTLCILLGAVAELPRIVRAFRAGPGLPPETDTLCEEIAPAEAFAGIKARLQRLPFTWRYAKGILYGRRRPYAAAGGFIFYLGVVLILVGGLARLFGHRDEIFVFEGYGVALPPDYGAAFEIRADRVDVSFDANTGDIIDYGTAVRILVSGREVAQGDVGVNRPLRYRAVNVYQSQTGGARTKGLLLEVVKLREGVRGEDYGRAVFEWKVGAEGGRLTLAPGEEAALGDTGLRLRYADYLENFAFDDAGVNDDGSAYNPVAFVNVVNDRGGTAIGFLYKLTPEKSFLRTDTPDFDSRAAEFNYVEDGGPWRAGRSEYLFASGSYLAVGGNRVRVAMGAGEGNDLRARSLVGKVVGVGEGTEKDYAFPFGKRVVVNLRDGAYVFRFAGVREGRVTGFSVTEDPGIAFFYVGCVLLAVGVCAVALLRYEEIFAYVRGGRVCLAVRASPGGVRRDVFDEWVERARGGWENDAA